ncbi:MULTISPECIES: DUF2589 domain-containing protein [Streptomyces]|uniref:DUF2589 domain-containing protein n=2 Tax=Streptomyces TaxID=1883 RepID=A0A3M8FAG3_9ACTN|nr:MULTISPECIES: DUF2589 domain-containing protein [Streptomyces]KNE82463.1 hypothetical protein ADZ36_10465 [Streptomyces fradiae]OFA49473.1 hypothetical protein BEN35_17995 [Streptomyces fradiae]PQM22897.1 DUF2589 domain-containing protein [Streptomyces xinghaiensis]RKM97372.1 DUF2589 domain-containing protein [Streptomyces xinghaiensis]RNC73794.1 DUF2589 domain-containing protein [Streptomyces xinghaiensis]
MAVGDELSSLDFSAMIGGPLSAVVHAQAQSAQSSVDYIKSVGFGPDGSPTMVSFAYDRPVETRNDQGVVTGVEHQKYELSVPILTMLQPPFIRVQEATIEFNAKINSVQESSTASSNDVQASLGASAGWLPFSASLKVNYSHQQSTSEGSKVERTYSMAVKVKAVQDEMPAGTERLLNILERGINEAPAGRNGDGGEPAAANP